jgi:hypothetical protein
MKSCKGGYLSNYDKVIKNETRFKNNLVNNKSIYEDEDINSIPVYENRIKGVIKSVGKPKSVHHTPKSPGRRNNTSRHEILIQDNPSRGESRQSHHEGYVDYKQICDQQKDEINVFLDNERNYKLELEHLRRQVDELNKRGGPVGKYGDPLRQVERIEADIKNHYEELLAVKDEENVQLKKSLNAVEYEKENLVVKFGEFFKRVLKYLPGELGYYQDTIDISEIDRYLYNIERLVEGLASNKEAAYHDRPINEDKINQMNRMLDELKSENNTLK